MTEERTDDRPTVGIAAVDEPPQLPAAGLFGRTRRRASGAARAARDSPETRRRARMRRTRRAGTGRPRRLPFAVLITGLILGGLVLLLVLNTASAANEVRRRDLAVDEAKLAAQVQELRNDVAASAAPDRLAAAAAALGMVAANHPAFLQLGPDGSVTVLGKPGGAHGAVIATIKPKKKKKKPASSTSAAKTSAPQTSSAKTSAATSSGRRSGSPGRTGASTSGRSSGRSSTPAVTPSKPTTTPTTPTPTVTLPGGDR